MSNTQFQMITKSGDFHLVEIYEKDGDVVLSIGDKRFDIDLKTAFELADGLYFAASSAIDAYYMEGQDNGH